MNALLVPDTTNYLIAGYIVIGVMMGGYILSLILRWQRSKRQWKELEIEN